MLSLSEEDIYCDLDESVVDYGGEIQRMMLRSYGVVPSSKCLICESAREDSDEKLFGLTLDGAKLTFTEEEIVEYVANDKAFNAYCKSLYSRLDDDLDAALLDEWSSDCLIRCLTGFIDKIDSGEVLRFDDFFRAVCERSESDDASTLVDSSDPLFSKMPNIVRIK